MAVNTLKSLFVVTVLAAVSYGVYLTITGKPDAEVPPEAAGWNSSLRVEAPPVVTTGAAFPSPTASTEPPPPFVPTVAPLSAAAAPGVLSEAANPANPPHTLDSSTPPFVPPTVGAVPAEQTPVASEPPTALAVTAPPTPTIASTQTSVTSPAVETPATTVAVSPVATPTTPDAVTSVLTSPAAIPPAVEVPTTAAAELATLASASQVVNEAGSRGDGAHATDAAPASTSQKTEFAAAMEDAYAELDRGKLVETLERLSAWYDDPRLDGSQYRQLTDLLDRLAGTIIYSRQHLLEPAYVVQPGETLDSVAAKYEISPKLLGKINGIANPQQLRIGDELKVIRGPFDATVNLTTYELTLFLGQKYAGRFRIGIGRDKSTPEGEYKVLQKFENPSYYGIDRVIGADDPSNPLGERLIDLGSQVGIHGTDDPNSIGRADSRGSVRLGERDIADVYDILSIGSRVVIRR